MTKDTIPFVHGAVKEASLTSCACARCSALGQCPNESGTSLLVLLHVVLLGIPLQAQHREDKPCLKSPVFFTALRWQTAAASAIARKLCAQAVSRRRHLLSTHHGYADCRASCSVRDAAAAAGCCVPSRTWLRKNLGSICEGNATGAQHAVSRDPENAKALVAARHSAAKAGCAAQGRLRGARQAARHSPPWWSGTCAFVAS